jgi:DNA-binding MarR family transcriptional regulator
MAEPRWLNAEERRAWLAFIIGTRLLFAEFERDLQRDVKMPLTYYEILSVLSSMPNRSMRLSDLAEALQVSPSRLSHAIDRMQESGWTERRRCASDRRGWLAVLTDEGYAVLEAAAPTHVESVRSHLFDQLSPEQVEQLRAIGEALIEHLAPGGSPVLTRE